MISEIYHESPLLDIKGVDILLGKLKLKTLMGDKVSGLAIGVLKFI